MRAFEIAMFLVMVAAGLTVVAALDIFPNDAAPVDTSMFGGYTVTELNQFPTNPSIVDYFFLMVFLIINSIKWALTVLLTVVIFFPYLMTALHIPQAVAIPLNAGIWFVFVIAIVQIWRGQSIDIMR